MPTFTDPLTGTRIDWDARQDSVVTVTGEVGAPLPFTVSVPLTVKFRRRDLAALLHVEDRARLICEDQARLRASGEEALPAALIDEQALSGIFLNVADSIAYDLLERVVWYDIEARDILHRPMRRFQRVDRGYTSWVPKPLSTLPSAGELPLLRVSYPQWLFHGKHRARLTGWFEAEGARGRVTLGQALFHALFPLPLLLRLLYPPRGKTAKAWPLLQYLPLALFMAARIVEGAQDNQSLVTRITRTLKDESEADVWEYVSVYARVSRRLLPVKATAVALIDRAFRRDARKDAWAKYKVKRLFEFESPQAVFHHYLFSREHQRIDYQWRGYTAKEQLEQLVEWARLLLGPPGQAARKFGLLR